MKEFIRQKYHWLKLAVFLSSRLVLNPLKGIHRLMAGDIDKSYWWFRETQEAYYWLKIHLTYKSKYTSCDQKKKLPNS